MSATSLPCVRSTTRGTRGHQAWWAWIRPSIRLLRCHRTPLVLRGSCVRPIRPARRRRPAGHNPNPSQSFRHPRDIPVPEARLTRSFTQDKGKDAPHFAAEAGHLVHDEEQRLYEYYAMCHTSRTISDTDLDAPIRSVPVGHDTSGPTELSGEEHEVVLIHERAVVNETVRPGERKRVGNSTAKERTVSEDVRKSSPKPTRTSSAAEWFLGSQQRCQGACERLVRRHDGPLAEPPPAGPSRNAYGHFRLRSGV